MDDLDVKQWYSNKDLFEKLMELEKALLETQLEMKKYNNLRQTLNDVIASQKNLTEMLNETIIKVNKIEEARYTKRETFKDSKEIILLIVAILGWFLTFISFLTN